jgi:hypothetical protein
MAEFLDLLNRHQVAYAICGGHAVAFHGHSRLTMDLDVLVLPTADNAGRLSNALQHFGFGACGVPAEAFAREGTAVSLGVQPNQIDLLTSMSSQPTSEVLQNSQPARLGDLPVRIVARNDLIRAKRESARPKDLADLAELEAPDR